MSEGRPRLFVALELPASVAAALAGLARELADGREGLRPLAAESLHVTLVFLGSRAADEVDGLWSRVAGSVTAGESPRFAAGGVIALPRRRPRVFALELSDESGRATALQAAVADALGVEEGRRWLPHVTLVRVGKGAVAVDPGVSGPALEPFSPPALTLFRSHPRSRYEPLQRLELPV